MTGCRLIFGVFLLRGVEVQTRKKMMPEKRNGTLSIVRCERGIRQEKYAAAWLVSRKYIETIPEIEGERLRKRGTMMEAATLVALEQRGGHRPISYKSLDLLDFYVVHLSWYERRLAFATKFKKELREPARAGLAKRVQDVATVSAEKYTKRRNFMRNIVAVMPYYARSLGQGPSSVSMRAVYLNATLTTVRKFANPVVCVENEQDYMALKGVSLFDLLYLPGPSPEKLGLASLLAIHRLINRIPFVPEKEPWWRNDSSIPIGSLRPEPWLSVDYIFYTESDQLPTLRALAPLLRVIDNDPNHAIILPRRALPLPLPNDYPDDPSLAATEELQVNAKLGETLLKLPSRYACCFLGPKADACKHIDLIDRHEFASHGHNRPLIRHHPTDFALLPGEGNFLKMKFRACELRPFFSRPKADKDSRRIQDVMQATTSAEKRRSSSLLEKRRRRSGICLPENMNE